MTDTLDEIKLDENERGRIVIKFLETGFTMDVAGAIGPLNYWGAAELLRETGEVEFTRGMMEQAKRAQATGLTLAKSIPQDHRKRGGN